MADFRDDAPLDTSQIEDDRGGGGGFGGFGGLPGGGLTIGGGGGILGIIVALVVLLSGGGSGTGGLGALDRLDDRTAGTGAGTGGSLAAECRTGADAERREDCRVVGYVNSIQTYWSHVLGGRYVPAKTRFFTGSTQTGCGPHGSSAQRQRWFTTGDRSGNRRACDTFSGSI